MNGHPLQPLLRPTSVALVGASARVGSLGQLVWKSLLEGGFKGRLYAVNPKYTEIEGQPCVPGFADLPRDIDLVVVTTPAATVPAVLDDAGRHGVRAAVVLSAGFGETGAAGAALEAALKASAKQHGMRVLGPNCVGLQRPDLGLNASFAATAAKRGDVALLSQSGAICTALVDAAWNANFGFSSVISLGAAADLDFGEILDFLIDDPATRSILLYVEGIHDARSFMSNLRAAARVKPVLVLKAGRHAAGAHAARSHTGALVGDDAVFEAALARCGAIRVAAYEHLFGAAHALALRQRLAGARVAVVTNGGGPGVLTADAALEHGLEMAVLADATYAQLKAALPPHAGLNNPVDLIGDAGPERFTAGLRAVLADPGVDGVITLYCPTRVSTAADVGAAIAPLCMATGKPVLTVWLGGAQVQAAAAALEAQGVPAFDGPLGALVAMGALADFRRHQRMLLQAPPPLALADVADFDAARRIFAAALAQGRTMLNEPEAKAVLACCGIAVPQTHVAPTEDAAVAAAERCGYPVVLKVLSPEITHKTDVEGVRLDIRTPDDVRTQFQSIRAALAVHAPQASFAGVAVQPMVHRKHARELLIGVARDPVFGPVLTCGSGGVAVEVLRDFAIGLPPLNLALAEAMVAGTRAGRLLKAYRDVPAADRAALLAMLLHVSDLVCHLPQVREMDLNPVLVDAGGAVVLDARIVLDGGQPAAPDLCYSHLAVHPYPDECTSILTVKDGLRLEVRPIRPEDSDLEMRFIAELSAESSYFRFLSVVKEVTPEIVARFTQIDYDREMALVAVTEGDQPQIAGVARYIVDADRTGCEFAVVVADAWQGRGIGGYLITQLMAHASSRGVARFAGLVMANNRRMLSLMEELGFTIRRDADEPSLMAVERHLTPS